MVNLGTVHSNFVKSMKLNIDVVRKERKDEQDRRTCIWPNIEVLDSFPTIHRFTLDYPIGIVGGHPISPSTTGGSATTHPSTLTFNLFHFEKIRHEDPNTECNMFRLYDINSLYYVLILSQVYFSKVDGDSYRFSCRRLREVCRRRRDW